eukprot:2474369-Rhodomonas_salina.1
MSGGGERALKSYAVRTVLLKSTFMPDQSQKRARMARRSWAPPAVAASSAVSSANALLFAFSPAEHQ